MKFIRAMLFDVNFLIRVRRYIEKTIITKTLLNSINFIQLFNPFNSYGKSQITSKSRPKVKNIITDLKIILL